jgi:hypothetical protein
MSASQVILKCGASEYFLPNASKKVETLLELIQGAIEVDESYPKGCFIQINKQRRLRVMCVPAEEVKLGVDRDVKKAE